MSRTVEGLTERIRAAIGDFQYEAKEARLAAESPDNNEPDADEGYAVGLEYAAFTLSGIVDE